MHSKKETKSEFKQGKYRPIGRIAVEEGGGILGWQQAPSGHRGRDGSRSYKSLEVGRTQSQRFC